MTDTDTDISRARLIHDGTFVEEDRLEIRRRRRGHNRLGFAYQIAFVRILGQFDMDCPSATTAEIGQQQQLDDPDPRLGIPWSTAAKSTESRSRTCVVSVGGSMATAAEETMVAMDGRRLSARARMTRHGGPAGKRAWLLRGYGLCWTDPRARQASWMTGRVHPESLMVHTRRQARAILTALADGGSPA